jgi:hypothetical protein
MTTSETEEGEKETCFDLSYRSYHQCGLTSMKFYYREKKSKQR